MDDLCRSDIRGLSARDFLDPGRCDGWSDSEKLDAMEDALDRVGDRVGRSISMSASDVVIINSGSGYTAVAVVADVR